MSSLLTFPVTHLHHRPVTQAQGGHARVWCRPQVQASAGAWDACPVGVLRTSRWLQACAGNWTMSDASLLILGGQRVAAPVPLPGVAACCCAVWGTTLCPHLSPGLAACSLWGHCALVLPSGRLSSLLVRVAVLSAGRACRVGLRQLQFCTRGGRDIPSTCGGRAHPCDPQVPRG